MEEKLLDIAFRKKIIADIKSDENIQRKVVSYKKNNMQQDNFYQYVREYLESKLDQKTVDEMSIFASINLQRRISKSEASIYTRTPGRTVSVNGSVIEEMDLIYEDMGINNVLRYANEAYKYEAQCTIQVYPENRKLKARVLLPHHFDVVPNEINPEVPEIYIISNFDNTSRDRIRRDNERVGHSQGRKYRDQTNQIIADYDDQAEREEIYTVWSKSYNFVMNGRGEILDKETQSTIIESFELNDSNILSPLFGLNCLPFVDVSAKKNFEYWVRGWDSLYDSTILYNVILTSEFQTVEMQGHAQAFYKGDANHLPENMRIGPDKIILIPIDPNNPTTGEFGFANPGSDLAGIREFRESYLMAFLSSRGLDTSVVSGKLQSTTTSSGVEKLLQMVEKFEASQEDLAMFEQVEMNMLDVIACYVNSFRGERENGELLLNDNYQISLPVNLEEISLNVQFAKPEMIKTQTELLDVAQKEIEMGLMSKVHVLMELKNMTKDEAIQHLKEVDEFEFGLVENGTMPAKESDTNLNEITLGIERLARVGDVDALNALRKSMFDLLRQEEGEPMSVEKIVSKAEKINEVMR